MSSGPGRRGERAAAAPALPPPPQARVRAELLFFHGPASTANLNYDHKKAPQVSVCHRALRAKWEPRPWGRGRGEQRHLPFPGAARNRGLVGDGLLGPPPTRRGRQLKPVVAEYDFTPLISQ